jgi:hypothetical protein
MGFPRTFPRSKHTNLSYERAFGAYAANQEIDVATHTAKRARQLRKQVGRLRPDQAAPRWLSLCSPRLGKKRIEASSHARADEIRRVIILERLNYSRPRQAILSTTKLLQARKQAKHVIASTSDSHIARIFLFLFTLREGGNSPRLTS